MYKAARQETIQKTPFSLVYRHDVTTLDEMLPHKYEAHETGTKVFTQREEARPLA